MLPQGRFGDGGGVPALQPWRTFPHVCISTAPLNIQGWSWNGGVAAMGKVKFLPRGILSVKKGGEKGGAWSRASMGAGGGGASEWLVVPHREVPFRCGGARRALVHALGAGALVLLFGAHAGCDGGRGRGRGAGLLLKVCYDHCHVPYSDGQLLSGAPVDVLQLGPGGIKKKTWRSRNWESCLQRSEVWGQLQQTAQLIRLHTNSQNKCTESESGCLE